jgi:pimeloyl-ACP methyl ester carboxylesterase
MADRFLVWLGAGVLTAGVGAAMVAGAGVATADSPPGSDIKGTAASESAKPAESKADSDDDGVKTPKPKPAVKKPKKEPAAEAADPDEPDPAEQAADEQTVDGTDPQAAEESSGSDTAKKTVVKPAKKTAAVLKPAAKPTVKHQAEAPKAEEPAASVEAVGTVDTDPAVVRTIAAAPETAAVAFAAPASTPAIASASASPLSGLLSAVGTIVFNLYGLATRLLGGPVLPANSTVTVRSSSLVLECGCDEGSEITVPADWYIPKGADQTPPDRLIYLQHGFLASGPWYSHTAAALAEQANSIVVAPSITSNFFAADACWLGAPTMHEAMAKLFDADNTALADSAAAAGYTGPIPDRVVLVGHSLGGGAVAGISGAMADNGTLDRLAGVVMLDGVPFDPGAADSLKKVPVDIPIYQLASPEYFWNEFGVGTKALHEARPNQFIGVTLVGGAHVDSMRGGNPLIQFSQQLVSGFSKPQNVAAAQILMVGWVKDMFAGNKKTGIYLNPGEQRDIETPAGQATLVDLPNSLTKPFILNPLRPFVQLGNGLFNLEPACAADSMAVASCKASVAA